MGDRGERKSAMEENNIGRVCRNDIGVISAPRLFTYPCQDNLPAFLGLERPCCLVLGLGCSWLLDLFSGVLGDIVL